MKYIIDIPKEYEKDWIGLTPFGKELYYPMQGFDKKNHRMPTGLELTPYTGTDNWGKVWMEGYKEGLEAGRNDAWHFAKNLLNYTNKDWEDLMNLLLVNNCSYQEAKDMYEKWEKEKNEIQIGDEVKCKDLEDKGIVTSKMVTRCDVLWLDGTVSEDVLMSDLCKTGRHFDEIQNLLKTIGREEKNE